MKKMILILVLLSVPTLAFANYVLGNPSIINNSVAAMFSLGIGLLIAARFVRKAVEEKARISRMNECASPGHPITQRKSVITDCP